MTSVGVTHPFQETTEIFETTTYYEDMSNLEDVEQEMMDYDKHLLENGFDDQDTYNADNESTVVEPPQSDAVMTHAASTIIDEMEYLDDVDYEADDVVKPTDIVQESTDEPEVTVHTPPAESSTLHPPMFSPASRMIPNPRPSTPLLNLSTTVEADPSDDEWPICLETPTGQEYILFRSDGDTEALFEDAWLKSQSLETFFSSLRQTLADELAGITTSFAMEEIVLAIPDLEVSIAEDNCYTREISLQDLVNLINSLHVKNGTERPETCRLYLTLQPRFIARFNQLVSLSAQTWDSTVPKAKFEAGQHVEADEQQVPVEDIVSDPSQGDLEEVVGYEEYEDDENAEGDENADELQEYEEDDSAESDGVNPDEQADPEADDGVETTAVPEAEQNEDEIAAEEDELYEENDELYDPNTPSAEHAEDDADTADEEQDDQGEEEHQDEPVNTPDIPGDTLVATQNDNGDNDDLISYEEAVDQTDDGQDYRQQYIDEQNQEQYGETNGGHYDDYTDIPATEDIVAHDPQTGDDAQVEDVEDTGSPSSKRPLDAVVDPALEDEAPPSKRAKS